MTAGFTLLRPNPEKTEQPISRPSPFKVPTPDVNVTEPRRSYSFHITDLPTADKPIKTLQLSSGALGASPPTNIRSTEMPMKRDIYSRSNLNTIDPKETNSLSSSSYIHPTTYSVPKYFLEALLHKTTPQGFKLPTTTPKVTTTTTHIEYYDYFDDENEANNTIPLLPDNFARTKDVVISSSPLYNSVSDNTIPLESDYNDIKSTTLKTQEVPSAPILSEDIIDQTTTSTTNTSSTSTSTSTEFVQTIPQTSTSTSYPHIITTFPTNPGRVSRINPAIKSITSFRGASGTSKCTGNSILSNVKCNEIQQRYRVILYQSVNKTIWYNRPKPIQLNLTPF